MPARHARELCEFIDASPTAYHAVDSAAAMLKAFGARRLDEREAWRLEPGVSYYVVRDDASLAAFRLGSGAPCETGFAIAGAHTDTPGLCARYEKPVKGRGLERVAVEAYGSPIHASWMDRPLSMAGRVIVRDGNGRPVARLLNLARPVAVIPNLAIHFNREMNKGVEYPMQNAMLPFVSARTGEAGDGSSWMVRAVARELGVEPADILAAELSFVDAAPSLAFGDEAEMLSAPRIDNLEGCHAVLSAFCSAPSAGAAHAQVAVLFDNEEIGSNTARGADSGFLRDLVTRLGAAAGDSGPDHPHRALARSLIMSVDGAQGWHPGYAERFDEDYAPVLNRGPAVKSNANFRYATDSLGEVAFRLCCEEAGVPFQRFRMRADLVPGSTIGPVSSALLGVRTVDVGVPMLAMHSVREMAGAYDHDSMIASLRVFYARGPGLLP